MKLPKIKIPIKELPLVALGITCVLISGLFNIAIAKYLFIGMFFGIMSKETRWTFWGFNVLIEMFGGFRMLLRTDRFTMMLDTISRIGAGLRTDPVQNITSPIEKFLINAGNNPIITNPISITIISIIFAILGFLMTVVSMVLIIGYIMLLLPVVSYMVLMMYSFHRDKIKFVFETLSAGDPIPEWLGRLIAPYMVQGLVIQVIIGTAIFPLVFYRILKRIGFYKRIPITYSYQ